METINYSSKIFVGVNKNSLGYLIPYEKTETQAFKDKEQRVITWTNLNYSSSFDVKNPRTPTTTVLDNEPLSGFEIRNVVSRYSTSNKLFRIRDPRGFYLEIYAKNLEYLISNCTIKRGNIMEDLVWGRHNGNIFLSTASDESYARFLSGQKPGIGTLPKVGETFINKVGLVYKFIGKKYVKTISSRMLPRPYPYRLSAPREYEHSVDGDAKIRYIYQSSSPYHFYYIRKTPMRKFFDTTETLDATPDEWSTFTLPIDRYRADTYLVKLYDNTKDLLNDVMTSEDAERVFRKLGKIQ